MEKILVTGANGFIGQSAVEYFLEKGYEVYGIDLVEGNVCGIKVESVNLLTDDFGVFLDKTRPDIILHCAGCADVGKSVENPFLDFEGNTIALHKMLFAIKKHGFLDIRFILLSSAGVYGQPKELPIREDFELHPISPYALHKKMAEDICLYFISNYNLNIKIARIFSAYGPGLRKQIFWDMNSKVEQTGRLNMYGTGEESRDFIYITDIMQALFLLASDTENSDNIYNIANGQEVTIRYAAEIYANAKGLGFDAIEFNGKVREGDPLNWRADISRLQKLGYKNQVSFEKGIAEYVQWCDKL